ncbi:MAG: hypothetical protein F4X66_04045 [Chloroflexi bacterium]|nr:hypothetical protein [Chloroflexota bacterium]MYE41335.1 hypothetical protein [Chloroflexota bacterium]
MVEQNEYARGYEAAYAEIRAAIRDNNHPSVFECPCPACEVIAEVLQSVADTMNYFLTDDEAKLFQWLLQTAEGRHNIEDWPGLILESESKLRLDQKVTPE